MARQSAGLLVYKRAKSGLQIFLVHPGGPFWAKKDRGAWSIPKGEFAEGEEALAAACPEVDAGTWFTFEEAKGRIQPGQLPILEELAQLLEERRS